MGGGKVIEFVESLEPPYPREEKWVLIVSTLCGCPVGCRFCDAGRSYHGILTRDEILSQIDYLVRRRFPDGNVPVEKFKIQFARMGDPAFNDNVIDVLTGLAARYDAPGIMPSLSTIAPAGRELFFEQLLRVRKEQYGGRFQLQFSIHSTNPAGRDWLMPAPKWTLADIARYGERFFEPGGRKITLNFALAEGMPVDASIMRAHFDPALFLVKITPVNPTFLSIENGIESHVRPREKRYEVIDSLRESGYEVILSIGETEENHIGSNCGQHVTNYLESNGFIDNGYTYELVGLDTPVGR